MHNWYPSLDYVRDLVKDKLAVEKIDGDLSTFKYARKVHFDNLWDKIPYMKEIRGIVYDNRTGELVQAPPQKSFNYLERGYWKDVPLDTPVTAYKKYNGFMACATLHKGELVVSTTGTTNSDYAKWARETLQFEDESERWTDLYEIILAEDPHIVKETLGAVWLGSRCKANGVFIPNGEGIRGTLNFVIKELQNVKHEGFMVYDKQGNCCKLKSPYYLGKKFIMRSNAQLVESMYNPNQIMKYTANLDARWVPVVRKITCDISKEHWLQLTDQGRRAIIEVYEKEYW